MKPCRKCGSEDRYSSGKCKTCAKNSQAERAFSTKPCVKCGSVNRNKNGSCIPCQQVNKVARAQNQTPCETCGSTDRRPCGNCRNCDNANHAAAYAANPDSRKLREQERYAANPEKFKIATAAYQKARRRTDVGFRLGLILRSRIGNALRGNKKPGSAVRDLGCSVEELKVYLESKFQPGMSWDNYGYRGWHIDHIKPLASFDLTDRQQFLQACHYTNLQPLWAKDNFAKSDKIL